MWIGDSYLLSMITRMSSLDFFTTVLLVYRKVESLIWAQVALCKLATGADLTIVAR